MFKTEEILEVYEEEKARFYAEPIAPATRYGEYDPNEEPYIVRDVIALRDAFRRA